MQLITLDLENFRQHKKTSIEFRNGITGVIGKNGAGKTTLLEAIAWALYGAPAVRGKNADIRCHASEANQPVEVSLTFELDTQTYKVTRRLDAQGRPQGATLAINGIPARTGFSEVTDSVVKVLGMDYKAFFTSFFTAQKQLDFMSGMDGRERAEAISKMLGYERLSKARDKANQDRLALQHEVDGLEKGLPDPDVLKARKDEAKKILEAAEKSEAAEQERLTAAQAETDRLTPLKEVSEQKSKRHEELSRRLEADTRDAERAKVRIAQLKAEIAELEKKQMEAASLAGVVAQYNEAQKDYSRLAELQKFEAERQKFIGQLEAAHKDVDLVKEQIAAIEGADKTLAQAEQALAAAEKAFKEAQTKQKEATEKWIAEKQRLAAEINVKNSAIADIKKRRAAIEEAGKSGKCPTCERPLGDELPKVLAGFDDHAAKEQKELSELTEALKAAEKEPAELLAATAKCEELEKALAKCRTEKEAASKAAADLLCCRGVLVSKQNELGELEKKLSALPSGFDQQHYDELRKKGIELRPQRDRAIQLETEVKRLPGLSNEEKEEQAVFTAKAAEIDAANTAVTELAFSTEDHQKLMLEFTKASDALVTAKIDLEKRRGEVKEARATLEAVKTEEDSYKEKQAVLKEKRERRLYLRALADAFDAMRLDLNSQIRPELEETTSEIISVLTDGRYNVVEIDDSYAPWIIDDGERKQIISGGEDDLLNLALRLAISQMIANRSGHPLSLLVLDEVFGSLDDSRRDNVMELLANLRNRFDQIILITHIEGIRDAVDNCIRVQYNEETGISSIDGEKPEENAEFSLQLN